MRLSKKIKDKGSVFFIYAAASLTAAPLALYATPAAATVNDARSALSAANDAPQLTPYQMISFIVAKYETCAYVANDNGQGPSKCGILWNANKQYFSSFDDFKKLTIATAYPIYKQKYWDATGIGNLPYAMQFQAIDAAINIGPGVVQPLAAQANGDPDLFFRLVNEKFDQYAHPQGGGTSPWFIPWLKRQEMVAACTENFYSAACQNPRWNNINVSPILDSLNNPAITLTMATVSASLAGSDTKFVDSEPPVESEPPTLAPPPVTQTETTAAEAAPNVVPVETTAIPDEAGEGLLSAAPLVSFLTSLRGILFGSRRKVRRNYPAPEPKFDDPYSAPPEKPRDEDGYLLEEAAHEPEQHKAPPQEPPPSPTAYPDLIGFSEREKAAFHEFCLPHAPVALDNGRRHRIDHPDGSHTIFEPGKVTLYGELAGIELTLLYAAKAWGNKCAIQDATSEQMQKFIEAAQKMVDANPHLTGFTIQGVATFTPTPKSAFRPARQPQPIFNPMLKAA